MGSVMEHASVGMVSFKFKMGRWKKHYPKPGWNAEPRPAVRYSRVVWVVQQLRAAPKPYGFGDRMIWMTDCTKIPNLNLQLLKKIVFPQMEYSPETMRKMMINHDAPSNFGDSSPVRPQLMCFVSNCQVRAPPTVVIWQWNLHHVQQGWRHLDV